MKNLKVLAVVFLILVGAVYAAGTQAGSTITAVSTDVRISYGDGSGGTTTRNASEFSVPDNTQTILEINGIVETGVDLSNLPALDAGIYKNLIPSTNYRLRFSYLNRGNSIEDIQITANLTQAANRWRVYPEGKKTANEDEIVTLVVTVNPLLTLNLEQVTVNILSDLVTATNVVSYNAFAGAIGIYNGSYQADVQYGGTDNITHFYILEAEDYNVIFISRTSAVTAPVINGYSGNSTDVVPGAKILYTVIVKNNSAGTATGIQLRDRIPNNCHLYYDDAPSVEGASNVTWTGPVNNSAGSPGTEVGWNLDIPANGRVTASYTVTID